MIRNITSFVEANPRQKDKYRVAYTVLFTRRCCSNHKVNTRLIIKSTNEAFDDGVDGAVLMMKKTTKRIKNHKAKKRFDGIDLCNLDIDAGIGAIYFEADESAGSIWRLLWASAENDINKR